jgi:D-aspartate ligase
MSDGALVLASDYRGLGVAQSLGRHGVPVMVLDEPDGSVPLARYSRYVKKVLPFPPGSESAQVESLLELGEREGLRGWTLIPTRDDAAALCSRYLDDLRPFFRLSVPSWDVLRWTCDKRLGYQLAAEVGIPYPRTWELDGSGVDGLDCEYPVIIKPSVKRDVNALTVAKAWRVEDRAALRRRYDAALTFMDPSEILIQELIPGGGDCQLSFAALADGGRPVASLVARRTRQFPMDFGRASTFVETIDDPEVAEFGTRLLARTRHTGVIEIEFKRDPRARVLKLLDLNPRVWGWHTLGRRAGTDFSWLLWRLLHRDVPQPTQARSGARWMWLAADIPIAARELLGQRLGVREYIRQFRRPVEFGTLTLDDPLPGLAELPLHLVGAARRRLRRDTEPAARWLPVT